MYFKFFKLLSCGKRSGDHRRRFISGYWGSGKGVLLCFTTCFVICVHARD